MEAEEPIRETYIDIVSDFRWRIVFTYALSIVENILELLYPFAIGLAINGLIDGEGWVAVVPFASVWIGAVVVGATRKFYDTRLFTRIYGEVAGGMIERQRASGSATSEVAARAEMAVDAVDFFEFEVPATMTSAIGLVGGVAMLFVYNWIVGATMLGLLIPVSILTWVYGHRVHKLNIRYNNRQERGVDVIEHGGRGQIRAHFRALAGWRVRLSDAEAVTWTTTELLALGAMLFILLHVATGPDVRAGDVFAVLAYVLQVQRALDDLPIIVQQFVRLIDIRKRIDK